VWRRLEALGNAKLRIAMAYGIGSLYYMLLRTQGENPLQHPVKGELDRIKGYVQKAQKVRGGKGFTRKSNGCLTICLFVLLPG
jgi:exosome complex protein LRP1